MSDDQFLPVEVERAEAFGIVAAGVIRDPDLNPQSKALYALLTTYAGADRRCWPTRKTLADQLGCSRDSIDRALKPLVRAGVLDVIRREKDGVPIASIYRLHDVRGGRKSAATPSEGDGRTDAARGGRTDAATVAANLRRGSRTDAAQNSTNEQTNEQDHLNRTNSGADAPGLLPGMPATDDKPEDPKAVAKRLVSGWWEALEHKPGGTKAYWSSVSVVGSELGRGWTPEQIAEALTRTQPPLTHGSLEFALNAGKRRRGSTVFATPAWDGSTPDGWSANG